MEGGRTCLYVCVCVCCEWGWDGVGVGSNGPGRAIDAGSFRRPLRPSAKSPGDGGASCRSAASKPEGSQLSRARRCRPCAWRTSCGRPRWRCRRRSTSCPSWRTSSSSSTCARRRCRHRTWKTSSSTDGRRSRCRRRAACGGRGGRASASASGIGPVHGHRNGHRHGHRTGRLHGHRRRSWASGCCTGSMPTSWRRRWRRTPGRSSRPGGPSRQAAGPARAHHSRRRRRRSCHGGRRNRRHGSWRSPRAPPARQSSCRPCPAPRPQRHADPRT
mmetsp:Transcript_36543/g.92607  ORF Transcript_36543/g.92607 Transcript_36543/m.92607 type:complete len:273 (-) Transcript_36543:205-1023(-)